MSANGSFTFAAPVNGGGAYAVTVLTQPSTPAQTCTVTNGSGTASANVTNVAIDCVTGAFGISGTVSGLLTSGSVVLQNNGADNKPISADGAFSFTAQHSGTAYAVTVLTQPTTPAAQTCTVANGTGTVGSAAVSKSRSRASASIRRLRRSRRVRRCRIRSNQASGSYRDGDLLGGHQQE